MDPVWYTFTVSIILCVCLLPRIRSLYRWDISTNNWIRMVCRITGNFRGRKRSQISGFSNHLWKFSPRNVRHATPIYAISLTITTFRGKFLCKMLLSYQSTKVFFLESFPLYSMLDSMKICFWELWIWKNRATTFLIRYFHNYYYASNIPMVG